MAELASSNAASAVMGRGNFIAILRLSGRLGVKQAMCDV
jgi:hypothetical protein